MYLAGLYIYYKNDTRTFQCQDPTLFNERHSTLLVVSIPTDNSWQYLNVSSCCSYRTLKHKMFIMSCPYVRHMPWVTPTVAGFIFDKAAPHRNPIAETPCVFLSYLRTKFHIHRSQLIHYLAQSNREPKIVLFNVIPQRNITSKRYILFHGLSLHIFTRLWSKFCSTHIFPPHKFPSSPALLLLAERN